MDRLAVYVDTSVVLRRLLNQPGAIVSWSDWQVVVSSELMRVEAFRTLDRWHVEGKLSDDEFADCVSVLRTYVAAIEQVPISPAVLKRVSGHLPTPIGTLDAIHLVSALLWMESASDELVFVTHDRQLALAARACGLEVGP
jgi:predicted nucleic acid-binding protein